MMLCAKRTIITCLLLAVCWLVQDVRPAAASDPTSGGEPLKVAVMEIEPFVMKDGKRLTGFSIDLWQELASQNDWTYEYIVVESVDEQLEAVKRGEVDAGIGAISMTSQREQLVDFSHGYYLSGLQIMTVPHVGLDLLEGILGIVPGLLSVIGLMLLIILAFAHLVWLAERKNNPQIPESYLRGIEETIWFLVATLTTVGYGDIIPKSRLGRLSGILWMFVGLFLIAGFTASVASQFTVARLEASINGVQDLAKKEVGTVQDTTADQFLTTHRIRHTPVTDLDSAINGLIDGRFDAIVYDAPVLAYYLATTQSGRFELVGSPFDQQTYSIALPQGSEYREKINVVLLEMLEDGVIDELKKIWFGTHSY